MKMKKNILVITSMANGGGMEERYNRLWSYILEDFNIFVVLWKRQEIFYKLANNPNIKFFKTKSTSNKNLNQVVQEIIKKQDINIVEVNFASFRQFLGVDYAFIKQKGIKVIGVLHFSIKKYRFYHRKFYTNIYRLLFISKINKYFDYMTIIRPKENVGLKFNIKTKFVPNTSGACLENIYKQNNSRRALIILRIFKTNLQMLEGYIKFLQKNKYEIHIAGNIEKETIITYLCKKYNLTQDSFLGYIKVDEYLKANADKYLFACGIYMSALDAMSLGFPTLFWSSSGVAFINKNNYMKFSSNNFSLNCNSKNCDTQKDLKDLECGNIEKFQVLEQLKKDGIDKETVGKKYKDFLISLL